jgi:hypothetical protein
LNHVSYLHFSREAGRFFFFLIFVSIRSGAHGVDVFILALQVYKCILYYYTSHVYYEVFVPLWWNGFWSIAISSAMYHCFISEIKINLKARLFFSRLPYIYYNIHEYSSMHILYVYLLIFSIIFDFRRYALYSDNYSREIQLNKKQKRKTQLLKSPSAHAYTEFRSRRRVADRNNASYY